MDRKIGSMGVALLRSRIEQLCEQLQCVLSNNLPVQEDLAALQRIWWSIQSVTDDAEKRETHDNSVRLWLEELRDVANDAENVLDDYECELLRAKVALCVQPEASHHFRQLRIPQEVLPKSVITTIPPEATFCGKIADKIRKIRARFEKIAKQRDALHLRERIGQRQSVVITGRPPSCHFVNVPTIYGRGDDLEKVINMLYSDECKNSRLSVLPIVGMGGVGKTTLVQHVYNDQRVCDRFQMKGWVCATVDLTTANTVVKLTTRIIRSLAEEECHLEDLSMLQERLMRLLNGKRFLLVLDDVLNRKLRVWEYLQGPLRFGALGSTVITTTGDASIAKIMQTMPVYRLDCLSIDDCWAVFKECAFVDPYPINYQDLLKIGKKIVRKCRGLPLAAKLLGGLLSCETDVDVWEEVLQSDIWDLGDKSDGTIPGLRLSYLHLPSYLKQCFLYASMFPNKFIFDKNYLIRRWMARGFIRREVSKQAEDIGDTYFKELVQRSFFQCYPGSCDKEAPCFVMHDLIHDLARHISRRGFFQIGGGEVFVPNKVRHWSVVGQRVGNLELMLRAPPLESLQTLDLGCSNVRQLPDSIGDLKNLRCLNLDFTDIARLPDSVCKLYNLQTLSLVQCHNLKRLPKDVKNLCNLRCLKNERTYFNSLPSCFGKLTSLRTLDEFIVGFRNWSISGEDIPWIEEEFNDLSLQPSNVQCCGIEELRDLIHLRGTLQISSLSYVMNAKDARLADLGNKIGIRKLVLWWYWHEDDLPFEPASPDVQTQVLENLQPPDHLEVLRIEDYGGLRFPSWMAGKATSFSKLIRVELSCCEQCKSLPPLGELPSLKYLEISSMHMVETVGPEFCGHASVGFPELEVLIFSHMYKWVKWELAGKRSDFPRLRHLTLLECFELNSMVPLYLLPALEELDIWYCKQLVSVELRCGPSSMGLPPLRKVAIGDCPRARFSPDDDKHLLLPPTLKDLYIDSPLLVEWCEGGEGSRLSPIPNAKVWRTVEDGEKLVSTSVPEVECGKLVLKHSNLYGGVYAVQLQVQDKEEATDDVAKKRP